MKPTSLNARVRASIALLALGSLSVGTLASASQVPPGAHRGERHEQRESQGAFYLGTCVGEAAAQQGITLPQPQQGRVPEIDEATRQFVEGAIKTCRQQIWGAPRSPLPMESPLPLRSPIPEPAPSSLPMESPLPLRSPIVSSTDDTTNTTTTTTTSTTTAAGQPGIAAGKGANTPTPSRNK